jgi:asparagine synthase (glutamine-hydrolysing)
MLMPGLVSILAHNYDRSFPDSINKMAAAMQHEDFYCSETFSRESCPFLAARVHLNAVNTEPQPIFNEDGSLLIVMDGELYARDGLRERLRLSGHEVKTASDAELLLHLYEEHGSTFTNDLNGSFLALIHDLHRQRTIVVNDRLGTYRAFYTMYGDTLILASEIKCIPKFNATPARPNQEKFPEYFLYGGILNDQTLFKGVYRLPPASIWTYEQGTLRREQYFNLSGIRVDSKVDREEIEEETSRVFAQVVPRYTSGKVALSLTGGWDTRAILSLAAKQEKSIPCYTWRGPYRESFDVRIGREAAEAAGARFHVLGIGEDFLDNFAEYANKTIYVSDGTAGILQSHEAYLSALSRNVAPIRLTGKCGTQIMSGGMLLPKCRPCEGLLNLEFVRDLGGLSQFSHDFAGWQSTMDVIRWLWPNGFAAVQQSQVIERTPYLDNDLTSLLFTVPREQLAGSFLQKSIINRNYPSLCNMPSDKGVYVRSGHLLNDVRLGLRAAVIRRLVFLDKGYLYLSLPDSLVRFDSFMKRTHLERLFLGYSLLAAYRRWIKTELRDFIETILSDERTLSRPYLDRSHVHDMISRHFAGKANHTTDIDRIVSLELWHRLFVD